jgi:hypothetical protein
MSKKSYFEQVALNSMAVLLEALPKVERDQAAKERVWHDAVQTTINMKNDVATNAACLCDMVISAFSRNSPEGEAAMNVRAGLYSGPEQRGTTTTPQAPSADAGNGNGDSSAPRSVTPAASTSTVAA